MNPESVNELVSLVKNLKSLSDKYVPFVPNFILSLRQDALNIVNKDPITEEDLIELFYVSDRLSEYFQQHATHLANNGDSQSVLEVYKLESKIEEIKAEMAAK